ncbi:MAG TPA: amidohydrolase family protein, partial [Burkholderiaceae bacterium]|nr:amidohydrolase family protein [Burkholderiaceae bacterium]
FGEAEPGASALETLLPLTLKWATENKVPLVQALAKITSGPAAILGNGSAKGQLTVGAKADVVVFDASTPWVVSAETLISGGKNTPFAGYELVGRARYTLVGGEVRHASNR